MLAVATVTWAMAAVATSRSRLLPIVQGIPAASANLARACALDESSACAGFRRACGQCAGSAPCASRRSMNRARDIMAAHPSDTVEPSAARNARLARTSKVSTPDMEVPSTAAVSAFDIPS